MQWIDLEGISCYENNLVRGKYCMISSRARNLKSKPVNMSKKQSRMRKNKVVVTSGRGGVALGWAEL